jgi:sorting nexin-13
LRLHEKLSPQKKSIHRRNKSDTDLSWHIQKNVANSKFYTTSPNEDSLVDPETLLLNSFFSNSELYKKESLDDEALVEHLKTVTEAILYFILPDEEFDCQLLRTFLCDLLANVIFKPVVHMLADPDFINLQIAKQVPWCNHFPVGKGIIFLLYFQFIKDPPSGEFLLKMIRQSNDLSELRAVRQLITKEMDLKYKDLNCKAELDSLRYTQKIIDLRISSLQNNRNGNMHGF